MPDARSEKTRPPAPRQVDRSQLNFRPLSQRTNRVRIEGIAWHPGTPIPEAARTSENAELIQRAAQRIRAAREANSPVIFFFGAHLVKNGLGPLVARMASEGWITHAATNGASAIHDWEFAYQGASSECVRENLLKGQFGLWQETGRFLNLAVLAGCCSGLGFGESVARLITDNCIVLPSVKELKEKLAAFAGGERRPGDSSPRARAGHEQPAQPGAFADLLDAMLRFGLAGGRIEVPHPFAEYSLFGGLMRAGVPCTVHPGIGYDIIHMHPFASGGALGRAAMRDFLRLASVMRELSGGVFISVGSAVAAPMVFEKSLAIAQNLSIEETGRPIKGYTVVVNDLVPASWDWSKGEPPESDPAYYLRFCKSFSRGADELLYAAVDNRAFLGALYAQLK